MESYLFLQKKKFSFSVYFLQFIVYGKTQETKELRLLNLVY